MAIQHRHFADESVPSGTLSWKRLSGKPYERMLSGCGGFESLRDDQWILGTRTTLSALWTQRTLRTAKPPVCSDVGRSTWVVHWEHRSLGQGWPMQRVRIHYRHPLSPIDGGSLLRQGTCQSGSSLIIRRRPSRNWNSWRMWSNKGDHFRVCAPALRQGLSLLSAMLRPPLLGRGGAWCLTRTAVTA